MARNLELKVPDRNPSATLQRALALEGVVDHGVLLQRDTYFEAAEGQRVKRREVPDRPAELITYTRRDVAGPRESTYEVQIGAAAPDLPIRVVVRKARRLLVWRGTRIHLDDVEDLGRYVELEAVRAHGAGEPELDALVLTLHLDVHAALPGSYADLLEAARRGIDPRRA